MKKITLFLVLAFVSISSYAQMQEVRGVSTDFRCVRSYIYVDIENNNSFDVSVDVELVENVNIKDENGVKEIKEKTVATKSIILKKGEKYIWAPNFTCSSRFVRYKAYKFNN